MSTTFGIKIKGEVDLIEDQLPFYKGESDWLEEDFIPVYYRGNNKSGSHWINELGPFLESSIKVYPLDNTAQGIYTIGDIKRLLCLEVK